MKKLPKEIENIEIKISKINKELKNTNLYFDNNKRFNIITKEIVLLKDELQQKENRWLEILEMKETNNFS